MSLETYFASTPSNPVTVKSDTLVLIHPRKGKKHEFFATIFRVRAFYSSTGCRDFFLKCAMGTIMFPLRPWSETKPLKQNDGWKTKKKIPFPSKNPGIRFRGNSLNFREEIPTFSYCKMCFDTSPPPDKDLILPPAADWLVMSSRNGHPFRWVKNSPFPFCFGSSTFPQNVIYSKRFWQDPLSH